jgi:hypothetical protein
MQSAVDVLGEQQDLFPASINPMAGSDAVWQRALTSSLCADHRLQEPRWAVLRQVLASIVHDGTELLPMAARLLGDIELDRIGPSVRKPR